MYVYIRFCQSRQWDDGCPLGLGLVVEDEPTGFSCILPYSGKLSMGKTFADQEEVTVSRRKLLQNVKIYHRWVWHAPNFMEKTFTGGSKSMKFVNVFSLESFPL